MLWPSLLTPIFIVFDDDWKDADRPSAACFYKYAIIPKSPKIDDALIDELIKERARGAGSKPSVSDRRSDYNDSREPKDGTSGLVGLVAGRILQQLHFLIDQFQFSLEFLFSVEKLQDLYSYIFGLFSVHRYSPLASPSGNQIV